MRFLLKGGALYTDGQLRADNPDTSFPDDISGMDVSDFGCEWADEPPPEYLDQLEGQLHRRIDREAGQFRKLFITDVPGQQQTYAEKEREARAWTPEADPVSFPFLSAEAAARGVPIADVAALQPATVIVEDEIDGEFVEVATLVAYRNALPHLENHGLFVGKAGNGSLVFPELEPTKPGIFLCVGGSRVSSTTTMSTPSGMTELLTTSPSATTIRTAVFVEDRDAGATGTRTSTIASNLIGYSLGVPMFLVKG